MGKQQLLSEPIDDADVADLDRICAHLGASRENLVACAILRFIGDELRVLPDYGAEWAHLPPPVETDPDAIALNEAEAKAAEALNAYLKVGEDAADRGELIPQEEMEQWFALRIASRERAKAAE